MIRNMYSDRVKSSRGPSPDLVRIGAKQSFKDSCDLTKIVNSHIRAGVPIPSAPNPQFGDYSQVGDYQGSMNLSIDAKNQFDSLPLNVRKRFNNDPTYLLNFLSNNKNYDEAVSLGLVAPKEPKAPTSAPAVLPVVPTTPIATE